jgi:predicted nuclease of restriction endonuclease-like (RecB) superfamily
MAKKIRVAKRKPASSPALPRGYKTVVTDITRFIAESRRRALSTVNRELVLLYWHLGAVIVRQQEQARWGDAVVEQLARDLRAAFPDMKGLTRENLFRMRKFVLSSREVDLWLRSDESGTEHVATASPQIVSSGMPSEIVATLSPQFQFPGLADLIASLSWSHHKEIIGSCETPTERYFFMKMAVHQRWSVRELRRQIDSDLFTRYVSVQENPEKCLPVEAESGDLLPFMDHYVLEFLGLEGEHSERQLRHAILANLRDFFLEFGRDLTFVGEEYPATCT